MTDYKAFKSNTGHSWLEYIDTLTPSTYYSYKYSGIKMYVRVFPDAASAHDAFKNAYNFFAENDFSFCVNHCMHKYHMPHVLLWNYAGAYYIIKGKAIYLFNKECRRPEAYYTKYKQQLVSELFGKTKPDSCVIEFFCGGGRKLQ
jgi:hypothetical protein